MDSLQQELKETYPLLRIQFLGVNDRGQEPGNSAITEGRDLPWLQDVDVDGNDKSDVWQDGWGVTFRDVVILDGENVKVDVFNVTQDDLSEPENYAALRESLLDAAMASQKPWTNPDDPLDVDNSGYISALDVLQIVNRLNGEGPGKLPPPTADMSLPPYYDCSGDGDVTPLDVLQVVNRLNEPSSQSGGEGESLADDGQARFSTRPSLTGISTPDAVPAVASSVSPASRSDSPQTDSLDRDWGRPAVSDPEDAGDSEFVATSADKPIEEPWSALHGRMALLVDLLAADVSTAR